ncbi:MAG: cyclic nucleotide-binding domain-containing protein [Burkholderiaceae bacterium]
MTRADPGHQAAGVYEEGGTRPPHEGVEHMSFIQAWKRAFGPAAEGIGFALPTTIGSVGLLFAKVDAGLIIPGIFAAILGMALMGLAASANGRPVFYAVRILEITALASLLDQFVLKMPGWGLTDTPLHRLMLILSVCMMAALLLPICYALRLERFARMIPAPVFAGFSNAVGFALVISQTKVLVETPNQAAPWVLLIAVLVTGVALAVQRYLKSWPPGVTGLMAGTAAGLILLAGGLFSLDTVARGAPSFALPVMLVPWADLFAENVRTWAIASDVFLGAVTVMVIVFLNSVVCEETISQLDDRQSRGRADWLRTTFTHFCATALGSLVITPAVMATRAAVQVGALSARVMLLGSLIVMAVYTSGLLSLVPLAGIVGLLFFDAWNSFDRPSLRLMVRWVARRPTGLADREDLATMLAVMLAAIVFNMVVGIVVGVVGGLVLYAWRNGKRLVRYVDTGLGVRSNCSRSRADGELLAAHADSIRYVELEGALFFGAAAGLQALLREQVAAGRQLVIDWSNVINADSTVARAFAKVAAEASLAGVRVGVSGLPAAGPGVHEAVEQALAELIQSGAVKLHADADRALEWAENEVIARHADKSGDTTSMMEAFTLLHGVASDARKGLVAAFEQRLYKAGDIVFSAGEKSDDLMIIMHGTVNILLHTPDGRDIRLARIRRGALLGELSFLDQSPRSATAVAADDLVIGVMPRERFAGLSLQWPEATQAMLANMAIDMALRLRRSNTAALGRVR